MDGQVRCCQSRFDRPLLLFGSGKLTFGSNFRSRGLGVAGMLLSRTLLSCALLGCTDPARQPPARQARRQSLLAAPAQGGGSHWPKLPTSAAEAALLVARYSQPVAATPPPTNPAAEQLVAAIRRSAQRGTLRLGWPSILRELNTRLSQAQRAGRASYLLVGSFHDAPGQLGAFNRLIEPDGLALERIAVELFDTAGAWAGTTAGQAPANSDDLRRFLAGGDSNSFQRLMARQEAENYTAWKYGYLPEVRSLLLRARAAGHSLVGCDMPRSLLAGLGLDVSDPLRLRLRELHCALSLAAGRGQPARGPAASQGKVAGPERTLMFWGRAHLGPEALPRFLPPTASILALYLAGQRPPSAGGIEQRLASRLALAAPLLVPWASSTRLDQALLLLPGAPFGLHLERSRMQATPSGSAGPPQPRGPTLPGPPAAPKLTLRLTRPCSLLGETPGDDTPLPARRPQHLRHRPATPLLLWCHGRLFAIGLPPASAGDRLELTLDSSARKAELIWHQAPTSRAAVRD